uniref:Uncharacterized protein n=1 Tax=Human betaherpesvirus 6 TaxID=10368 RepID=A0A5P9SBX9_9BETA|nr:hypothetical protein [Human betaherpesvirus 6]QFV71817.1 hypothetical protein [Human betaherpesvirus 6]
MILLRYRPERSSSILLVRVSRPSPGLESVRMLRIRRKTSTGGLRKLVSDPLPARHASRAPGR